METLIVFQNIELNPVGRKFTEADFDDSCSSKRRSDVIRGIRPVFYILYARDLGPITLAPLRGRTLNIVTAGVVYVYGPY